MKTLALLGCLIVAELTAAQALPGTNPALERAARADNAFGFKLLAETRKALPGGNVFQSPAGLAFALSLVETGAEGETLHQMARTLQREGAMLPELNVGNKSLLDHRLGLDPKTKLEIANSLWTQADAKINPAFLARSESSYRAEVSSADFGDPATVNKINDWASRNTHGKIPQIISAPLDPNFDRLLVLPVVSCSKFLFQAVPGEKGGNAGDPKTAIEATAENAKNAEKERLVTAGKLSDSSNR